MIQLPPAASELRRLTLALVILLRVSVSSHAQTMAETGEKALEDDHSQIKFGFQTDITSRYVNRGLGFSRGPVEQSRVWLTHSGLTVYGWTNLVVGREPQRGKISEIDFGLAYMREWKGLTVEPAADCYWYPKPGSLTVPSTPPTGEASVKVSYPTGPARLFVKYALDIGSYPGSSFAEAGASSERKLSPRLTTQAAFDGVGRPPSLPMLTQTALDIASAS